MTARRAAILPALALAACTAASSGSSRLTATASAWTLSGSDLDLHVRAAGALAGRDLRLTIAVGDAVVDGHWRLQGGEATITIPAASLPAGAHRILVKCGSERSTLAIRVVPVAWAAGGALLLAALLVLPAALARRALRRKRGATGG